MMSEQQPEYVWAYPEEKPKRGRVWLIVGLAAAAVAIAVVVFWLFLRPGAPLADPASTQTPTAGASPSGSPSASEGPTGTPDPPVASPEPSMTPITTPPAPSDPSVDAFRGQVQGWLDDALTGLDIVSESSGQDATSVIDTLRADAGRLAELTPPSSIESDWQDALGMYSERLNGLRSAASSGDDISVDASRGALRSLREIVGL